jgi:carboxypeptidase C (cathepsin A)
MLRKRKTAAVALCGRPEHPQEAVSAVSLQANSSYRQYASGHMVYVNEDALRQFHEDVATFIRETQTGK